MTDNEIIKALEQCPKRWDVEALERTVCQKCPYYNVSCCDRELYIDALSLIKRQRAEIESLNSRIFALSHTNTLLMDSQEVYWRNKVKEFAERVQSEIEWALKNNYEVRGRRMAKLGVGETDDFVAQCTGKIYALRGIDDFIDDLVKEMVGDPNENL